MSRLPDGDWSVTVPVIIMLVPSAGTICGAETVVALGSFAEAVDLLVMAINDYESSVCEDWS